MIKIASTVYLALISGLIICSFSSLISCMAQREVNSSSIYKSSVDSSTTSSHAQIRSSLEQQYTIKKLPASSPIINYFGRIDERQPNKPTIIWQGSRISLSYKGQLEAVEFSDLSGSAYFDVMIDGKRKGRIKAIDGTIALAPLTSDQDDGAIHTFTLIKRSEASAGHVSLNQFVLNGIPVESSVNRNPHHFLFFGDSITAGACSEDGDQDQWDDRSTHNALVSYAALTANHFGAQYQNIAISGVGISAGYQPYTADQVWDKYYPTPSSARADLATFRPDIIFTNYGENDDSYTSNQNQPFPNDYTVRYLNFLSQIRHQYPSAAIVILRGGMWGGANSARLRKPLDSVVQQFTRSDNNAYHFAFNHWSSLHPRAADHQKLANELIAWLEHNALLQN